MNSIQLQIPFKLQTGSCSPRWRVNTWYKLDICVTRTDLNREKISYRRFYTTVRGPGQWLNSGRRALYPVRISVMRFAGWDNILSRDLKASIFSVSDGETQQTYMEQGVNTIEQWARRLNQSGHTRFGCLGRVYTARTIRAQTNFPSLPQSAAIGFKSASSLTEIDSCLHLISKF